MCPAAASAIRPALRLHPLPAGGAVILGTEIALPGSLSRFLSPADPCGPSLGKSRLDAPFPLLQRISQVPPKILVQCNERFYKVPADLCQQRDLPCWVELSLQE